MLPNIAANLHQDLTRDGKTLYLIARSFSDSRGGARVTLFLNFFDEVERRFYAAQ